MRWFTCLSWSQPAVTTLALTPTLWDCTGRTEKEKVENLCYSWFLNLHWFSLCIVRERNEEMRVSRIFVKINNFCNFFIDCLIPSSLFEAAFFGHTCLLQVDFCFYSLFKERILSPFGILKPFIDVIWSGPSWLIHTTCETQRKKPYDDNNERHVLQLHVHQFFSLKPPHFDLTGPTSDTAGSAWTWDLPVIIALPFLPPFSQSVHFVDIFSRICLRLIFQCLFRPAYICFFFICLYKQPVVL